MRSGTRVSSKGQVVIPRALREKLRWRAGTRLTVEELPDGVRLAVAAEEEEEDPIDALCGSLRGGPDLLSEFEAERQAEREREDDKWRRFDAWAADLRRKRRRKRI